MLDKAGCVSGRQLFALVQGLAEAAPSQTQTLRATPADETGGAGGPGSPPAGQQRQAEGRERRF